MARNYRNLGNAIKFTARTVGKTADGDFAKTCAQHYHLLREYMLEHSEVGGILRAID